MRSAVLLWNGYVAKSIALCWNCKAQSCIDFRRVVVR